MTDLEMTKKCAEAMGLKRSGAEIDQDGLPYQVVYTDDPYCQYDPLHDDAQAMALVKKFNLNISSCAGQPWSVWPNALAETVHADLNRAIVECVARMK